MKNLIKIFFSILLIVILLGIIFYMIDTVKVQNGEEPIFVFEHKMVDGVDYSAKVDIGLGYKIIRFNMFDEEIIKIGTIYMDETPPYVERKEEHINENLSGESGENIIKVTTFGEKYKDSLYIEGMEEEVFAEDINSKLGYTMKYYYELFEYSGFETYDRYTWRNASGDLKSSLTIYDISDEERYKESTEKITKDDLYKEISGDSLTRFNKSYIKEFKENEVEKVKYIYILEINDLKLMLDINYPKEAAEGVGVYITEMINLIKKSEEILK